MVKVITNLAIYPIIIPQKQFNDRFGNPNAFIDMNPSIFIDGEGKMTIFIRRIDYQKFQDKKFVLYNNYSNSEYAILEGKIEETSRLQLDNFDFHELTYDYGRSIYRTYWKGPEDIRFIDKNSVLVTVPECNPSGQPCIFLANIENKILKNFTLCEPSDVEKNWMPFYDIFGNRKVIYSVYPLLIKSVEKAEFQTINHNLAELNDYHGSTNGIEIGENRLFLIHINQERTYHRWFKINLITNRVTISETFVFFKYSYIEFPISIAKYNDRIFISMGVNDKMSYIVEISMKTIDFSEDGFSEVDL